MKQFIRTERLIPEAASVLIEKYSSKYSRNEIISKTVNFVQTRYGAEEFVVADERTKIIDALTRVFEAKLDKETVSFELTPSEQLDAILAKLPAEDSRGKVGVANTLAAADRRAATNAVGTTGGADDIDLSYTAGTSRPTAQTLTMGSVDPETSVPGRLTETRKAMLAAAADRQIANAAARGVAKAAANTTIAKAAASPRTLHLIAKSVR